MSQTISRRSLLGAAPFSLSLLPALRGGIAPAASFRHRSYTGWITDLATEPDPAATWPSMRVDGQLLEDYSQTFRLMKQLGYNEVVIWGFFVSRNWPPDIRSSVDATRGAKIEKIVELAHKNDLRVLNGLGIYSWGFDEIIRAHPQLAPTNPHAMCASNPESWRWMRKVIDFSFERFPVDGASLQSADQGRCNCEKCSRWGDMEYHARLNIQVCDYVRSRWKNKLLGISGWGMKFADPQSLPYMVKMSEKADYIIDVQDTLRQQDASYRKKVIEALRCDFGTIGGPQVEPPQHLRRDRWFLPTVQHQGEHLAGLLSDGGRACEYFFHILSNPGDELSFWVTGKVLAEPQMSWQKHLQASVEALYKTRNASTRDALSEAFLAAENAYMRHIPDYRSGTISIEPLIGDKPGPPVYLTKRLNAAQRKAYHQDLKAVSVNFEKLAADVPEKSRIAKILKCIRNVQTDLEHIA